jgi:dipeptidyl aminopeptidase/acylaminoacyl peptidase
MVTTLLASAAMALAAAPAAHDHLCDGLLPAIQLPRLHDKRLIRAEDLVGLRDIGEPTDRVDLPSPLGVSPDGRRLAFLLRQAQPSANRYCLGIVVVELASSAPPRLLDVGGDLIRERHVRNGLEAPETGLPAIVTPRWSPDGRQVAFLKRTAGIVQVWVANATGTPSPHPVTKSPCDVETVEWSSDGRHLVFSARPALKEGEAAIAREGRGGFLFDDRFRPMASSQPFVPGPVARRTYSVDPETGAGQDADGSADSAAAPASPQLPSSAMPAADNVGARAWIEAAPATTVSAAVALRSVVRGRLFTCDAPDCQGRLVGVWPSKTADTFTYLRREGVSDGTLVFYSWRPGQAPRSLWRTTNLLVGCEAAMHRLVCLEEGPTLPRRLVALNPQSRTTAVLFEPNPEFGNIRLGQVKRLDWISTDKTPGFGHLVLPPDHRPGQQHPLVVVQYTSRGFLRGGTGDEYPVQLFAARGMAVLSFQYPPDLPRDTRPIPATPPGEPSDWKWRRRVQASLEAAVERAIASGVVDPDRIGITGLSDGATTVAWALANSHIFMAAAISSCCIDAGSILPAGPRLVRSFEADGYPGIGQERPDVWRKISLAANADRRPLPVLMQLSDDEYDHAFLTYYALKARRWPVEMFVFPDERHIKWQPSHRLAIYERSVDWFDYWLRGREDSAPDKAPQYLRWRALRGSDHSAIGAHAIQDLAQASASMSASRR